MEEKDQAGLVAAEERFPHQALTEQIIGAAIEKQIMHRLPRGGPREVGGSVLMGTEHAHCRLALTEIKAQDLHAGSPVKRMGP
ncbi:MAG: hypothetical protein SYC29_16655 [Planctomycetota bacterium]|nr:hypothetical protein [Planctomycetota bacterium]